MAAECGITKNHLGNEESNESSTFFHKASHKSNMSTAAATAATAAAAVARVSTSPVPAATATAASATATSARVVSSEAIHRIAWRGRVDSSDLAELVGIIDIDGEDDADDAEEDDNKVTFGPWNSQNDDSADGDGNLLICPRRQLNSPDVAARLTNWTTTTTTTAAAFSSIMTGGSGDKNNSNIAFVPTIQELFETLFPKDWIRHVLLVQTNKQLLENYNNRHHINDSDHHHHHINCATTVEMMMISYGEMLRFLGLWFLMATTHFDNMDDFWTMSSTAQSANDNGDFMMDDNIPFFTRSGDGTPGVPYIMRLDSLMSHGRFHDILNALQYTDLASSSSQEQQDGNDVFWQVRQMLQAWNDNMSTQFMASWISCLDITTSPWIVPADHEQDLNGDSNDSNNDRRYEYRLCPGFKCVPRMQSLGPLLLGNKYHVICCAKTGILYRLELDEGQDGPPAAAAGNAAAGSAANAAVKEFSNQGNNKTIGTWLRLTKPLFGSAKVVVLGRNMMSSTGSSGISSSHSSSSSDCMVPGLIELKKRGVFGTALIQKRTGQSSSPSSSCSSSLSSASSWPKHICGNDIIFHFADKDVGHADSLPGTFRGQSFHVACIKERPLANHHHHDHHHDDHVTSSNCGVCSSTSTSSNVTMLLSTYGTMERGGETKTRHYHDESNGGGTMKRTKTFQYPQVIQNHVQYQDMVESHTFSRMHPISLEAETWKTTTTWPNRVFQFLLAVTEVNCRLAMEKLFYNNNNNNNGQKKKKYSQQEFRKLLAKSLIYNTHLASAAAETTNHRNNNHEEQLQPRDDAPSILVQERMTTETATASRIATTTTTATTATTSTTSTAITSGNVHRLLQIPRYRTFRGENLVKVKTRYAQRLCQCKRSRVRSYCQCTSGLYLCTQCFAEHITNEMRNNNINSNNSTSNNSLP